MFVCRRVSAPSTTNTHTHTHPPTHPPTHARTHARTPARPHARPPARPHARTHARTHAPTHTHTHTCTYRTGHTQTPTKGFRRAFSSSIAEAATGATARAQCQSTARQSAGDFQSSPRVLAPHGKCGIRFGRPNKHKKRFRAHPCGSCGSYVCPHLYASMQVATRGRARHTPRDQASSSPKWLMAPRPWHAAVKPQMRMI